MLTNPKKLFMKKMTCYLLVLLFSGAAALSSKAQSVTIAGKVQNSASKEMSSAVSVIVSGSDVGTYTDDKGNFSVTVKSLPVTLIFTSVGYLTQQVTVSSPNQNLIVNFEPSNLLGQEIVVSASRVPQKILESPVTIERISAAAIRNAPSASFYDIVATLKGVDVTTSSLTFKTPTTRGFNASGNTRFNQLVDGMDNQAPGLNFSVGAIIGLSELDVDNIELLSGASSALYGPGGMNGTLLMTSKNPFKYQGLSFLVKTGVMNFNNDIEPSPYYNWNMRWGKKISEKIAFKVNAELIQAKDWLAQDFRNYKRTGTLGQIVPGDRRTDPNYDGINTYGDETTVDIRAFFANIAGSLPGAANFIAANNLLSAPQNVSRTGYSERELVNPNTTNFKLAGSFHYKLTQKTEATIAGYWGTGNTIYTGSDRYSLKDFKMGQYKVELNNPKYMFRAYTTQENSGNSYNVTATTRLFNESWKKSVTTNAAGNPTPLPTDWYVQYAFKYINDLMNGASSFDAHQASRALADVGRPEAGTPALTSSYDAIRKKPISQNGGLLLDRSDLYSAEGNYNFSEYTSKIADLIVGVNYRKYVLNSQGTLFADSSGPIGISEYGAYAQASRAINDKLNITASGRYDKNQNFEGRFTPRVTALYKVAKGSNIRLSYQTAYRFPSNQQQFINLQVGSTRLIGSDPTFKDYIGYGTNPLYTAISVLAGAPAAFEPPAVKPESVTSYELGYKGLLAGDRLLIDLVGYYGQYQNFLSRLNTMQTTTGIQSDITNPARRRNISVVVNATGKVKTYGFGASADYRLPKNFTIGGNVSSDVLDNVPEGFTAFFNAPKYRANANFGNTGFGKAERLAFNIAYKWQEAFLFQGDFASGDIPSIQTLDAQFSIRLPQNKSILKFGANNLLNQYYYNGIGNSRIGGLYYVSFGFNVY